LVVVLLPLWIALSQPTIAEGGWVLNNTGVSVDLHDITVSHGDDDKAWACGEGGMILHTSNGGATWAQQASGTTEALYGIAFWEIEGGPVIAVGAHGTILMTYDEGATWTPRVSGTTEHLRDVSDFDFYISGDGGTILRSLNDGATWMAMDSGTTERLNAIAGAFYRLALGENGVMLSIFGQGGWTPRDSGTDLGLRALPMFNANRLVVGEAGLVLRSEDGGTSWTAAPSGTHHNLNGVEYSVNNFSRIYCVGDGGTILRSTDEGASWFHQDSGVTQDLNAVFFYLNDDVGYACGDGGVVLTTMDGGAGPSAIRAPFPMPAANAGGLRIERVFPHPLAGDGVVRLSIPRAGWLDVTVFDIQGRRMANVFRGMAGEGTQEVSLRGVRLAAGAAFVRATLDASSHGADAWEGDGRDAGSGAPLRLVDEARIVVLR